MASEAARAESATSCARFCALIPISHLQVSEKFAFGLFDLDWDVFTQHIEGAINRVPVLEKTGIKSTVCGPGNAVPPAPGGLTQEWAWAQQELVQAGNEGAEKAPVLVLQWWLLPGGGTPG